MGVGEALLKAVCEHPDDDTPRLVYADWLDENGDPARAEFIRLSLELDRLGQAGWPDDTTFRTQPDHPVVKLVMRRAALSKAYQRRWVEELPGRPPAVDWIEARFRRGLADAVRVDTVRDLITHYQTILSAAPVEHCRIFRLRGAKKLIDFEPISRFRTISIHAAGVTDPVAEDLLRCPHLDTVRQIDLTGNRLSLDTHLRLQYRFGGRVILSPAFG